MKTFATYENVPHMQACMKLPVVIHAKQIKEFRASYTFVIVKSLKKPIAGPKPQKHHEDSQRKRLCAQSNAVRLVRQ